MDEKNYFLFLFAGDDTVAIAELSYIEGLENADEALQKAEKSLLEDGWIITSVYDYKYIHCHKIQKVESALKECGPEEFWNGPAGICESND